MISATPSLCHAKLCAASLFLQVIFVSDLADKVPFVDWNSVRGSNIQLLVGASKVGQKWQWDNGVAVDMGAFAPNEPRGGSADGLQLYGSDVNYGLDDFLGSFYEKAYACEK